MVKPALQVSIELGHPYSLGLLVCNGLRNGRGGMHHRAVALANHECPIPAIHNKYPVPVFTLDNRRLPSERFHHHFVGLGYSTPYSVLTDCYLCPGPSLGGSLPLCMLLTFEHYSKGGNCRSLETGADMGLSGISPSPCVIVSVSGT